MQELDEVVNTFKTHAVKIRYIIKDFDDIMNFFYKGNIEYSFQNDISVNPRLILHLYADHDQVYDIKNLIEENRPRIKIDTLYRVSSEDILFIVDYDLDWGN